MNSTGHIKLFWLALVIGLVWSVYSTTAELVTQVDRLSNTLFVCGNTWLLKSMM
jgi:hypothetical protein